MRETIRGFADAVVEDFADPQSLAEAAAGLDAVARLVASNDDLRMVLSDPGVATHVRRGVVNDLLSSQLDEGSMSLISHAIDTDRATELVDDLAWIAMRFAAERDSLVATGGGPLGRSAATERLDGYATSVLSGPPAANARGLSGRIRAVLPGGRSSSAVDLDDVEDELFRFSRLVEGADDLRAVLTARDTPPEARHRLVDDLLSGRASTPSIRLAAYATRVGRPRDYVELLGYLVERVAEQSQRQVAEVRAAVDLTEVQQRRLGDALALIVGHQVDVRVIIDPSVLGGFVANVGNSVIDGSARHRLEMLRERLVAPVASVTT